MCGIMGFFKTGETTKEQDEIIFDIASQAFAETQKRGTDASGFSYINKYGDLVTIKAPIVAEAMIKESKWLELKKNMPQSLIAHCRQMTLGDPLNNFNNHPLVVDKEISVIHNGMISNHAELKTKYSLVSKGQVDSEVIPLMIKKRLEDLSKSDNPDVIIKNARAINMVSQELSGGFACAMINKSTPNALYLFNHSNPITLVICETLNCIFFASTNSILEKGFSVPSNNEVKYRWFNKYKHHFNGDDLSEDTIAVLKLDNYDVFKKSTKELKFSLDFFDLKTGGFGTTSVSHYDADTKVTTYESVKTKISKVLKPKNGFDGVIIDKDLIQDWEEAQKDLEECPMC